MRTQMRTRLFPVLMVCNFLPFSLQLRVTGFVQKIAVASQCSYVPGPCRPDLQDLSLEWATCRMPCSC